MSERSKQEQAKQHLQDALDAEEMDETNYHIRQALQLIKVDEQ